MRRHTDLDRGHGDLAPTAMPVAAADHTAGTGARARRSVAPLRLVQGLSARLVIVVVLATLVAGGLVGSLAVGASRSGLEAEIHRSTLGEAEAIGQIAYRYMDAAETSLRDLAAGRFIRMAVHEKTPELMASVFDDFLQRHPEFDDVTYYDAQGISQATGIRGWHRLGDSLADRAWFQQAIRTGEPYLDVPALSAGSRAPAVAYAVAVLDENGMPQGMLVGGIGLGELASAIFHINDGIATRTSVIERRQGGMIVVHIDRQRILTPVSGRNVAVQHLLNGDAGTLQTASSTGQPTLTAYTPVPNLPWGIMIQYPTDVAFASVESLTQHVWLAILLAILIATAVGIGLALGITRPLRRLRDTATEIAAGDLSRRVRARGHDEIAELGRAFDRMADALLLKTRQIQAGAHELETLNQLGEWLQACTTVEEAHDVIGRLVGQLFPGMAGTVGVISASRNLVDTVATWGVLPTGEETIFAPDECWALRRGQPHVVADTRNDLVCPHLRNAPPSSYLCIPLVAHGEAAGLLHIATSPAGASGAAAPSAIVAHRLATQVAEQLALALSNLALRERLRNQSIRDPLTGLFNRRYLEETLERELARAERSQHSIGVIMIDVDHFKRFNDSFGHNAGDSLLREFGGLLRTHVRGGDIACRYGGEEFAVILPDATLEDTQRRAEQLREATTHLKVSDQDQALGQVTISLGVAALPHHGTDGVRLLRAADRALYGAKNAGRNRVHTADDPSLETMELHEAPGAALAARLGRNGNGHTPRPQE
jgi:diguanylate cyclase (GGDEF)-like protein